MVPAVLAKKWRAWRAILPKRMRKIPPSEHASLPVCIKTCKAVVRVISYIPICLLHVYLEATGTPDLIQCSGTTTMHLL